MKQDETVQLKQAKKTLGLSPISKEDIRIVMEDQEIQERDEGLKATIKDCLAQEMSIPKGEYRQACDCQGVQAREGWN